MVGGLSLFLFGRIGTGGAGDAAGMRAEAGATASVLAAGGRSDRGRDSQGRWVPQPSPSRQRYNLLAAPRFFIYIRPSVLISANNAAPIRGDDDRAKSIGK